MNNKSVPTKEFRRASYVFAMLALFLISISAMSSYFSYDEIGPLTPLLKKELGFSSSQIGWLYSVYSIPVILFVVLGGILADKLGVRKAAVLFTIIFGIGTLLVNSQNFKIMVVGRLLFGIGAEAFYVVMNKIIAKWFKDKMLAMAFGINLLLCRAGTYAAFFILPWLAENYSLSTSLWIVSGLTGIGLISTLLYWRVDRYGEHKKYVAIIETKEDQSGQIIESEEETFKLRKALKLPKPFWIISLLCVTYYSAIFPFTAFSTDFFTERYGLSEISAGRLSGVIILISMLTTWIFGAIIDKVGKRATLLIVGSLAMIPCHASMAYTDINPYVPMIVLGLSFSLVPAALWPALPLMVKEKQLGTAYGVIAMVQNIGLFAFPLLVGLIRDNTGSYNRAMLMFAGLGVLGVIFAIWLKVTERKGGGYLDKK